MESVRKRDGRSLDHKALEDIRIQAVQRVEAGEAPSAVMRVMGFARTVIYDWLNKYRAGGIEALRALPIPGRPPKLTEQQRAWVYRTVTQNNPLQLQFEFALWTRAMVRDLIRQNCGVTLSLASVGRLLRSLGLTPQRPSCIPSFCQHQITPKTSRYTRCSMSMFPNVSINGRIRSSGQLGRWWYSISPCRNNECVRRFTVFAFNQRS